jgi:hypothetical protein
VSLTLVRSIGRYAAPGAGGGRGSSGAGAGRGSGGAPGSTSYPAYFAPPRSIPLSPPSTETGMYHRRPSPRGRTRSRCAMGPGASRARSSSGCRRAYKGSRSSGGGRQHVDVLT